MDWKTFNDNEQKKEYCKNLYSFVQNEYHEHTCYPPYSKILNALNLTPYDNVKCVILGQDPYHEPDQAMGLSFSVAPGVTIPRSLQNIYYELHTELGCYIPNNGDLTKWATQGVLLLNSVLTVRAHEAASHSGHGWEEYTDAILKELNEKQTPVVFMLWGNFARSKKTLITNPKHLILETTHPSPFSVNKGFAGCGHFKKCNEYLTNNELTPIDWQIENL